MDASQDLNWEKTMESRMVGLIMMESDLVGWLVCLIMMVALKVG